MKKIIFSILTVVVFAFNVYAQDLFIERIIPNSPAEKAGLKLYDKIISINDISTDDPKKFIETIKNLPVGQHRIKINRDGQLLNIEVYLPAPSDGPRLGAGIAKIDEEKAAEYFNEALNAMKRNQLIISPVIAENSIRLLESAKQYDPYIPEIYYNLGLMYMLIEDYENARDNFERYITLAPNAQDIINAKQYLNKATQMIEKIELAKKKMLDPKSWVFIKQEPPYHQGAFANHYYEYFTSTQFKLSNDNQIYAYNPFVNYYPDGDKRFYAQRKYQKRQEWLKVIFKGRYFEYAYINNCFLAGNEITKVCPVDEPELDPSFISDGKAYPHYDLALERMLELLNKKIGKGTPYHSVILGLKRIKGEIKIDGNNIIVIQNVYNLGCFFCGIDKVREEFRLRAYFELK